MQQTLETRAAAEADASEIYFETESRRPPAWYDLGPPLGVALASLAVIALCVFLLMEPTLPPKCFGAVALAAYLLYAGQYLLNFARSRGRQTRWARLTGTELTVCCPAWTKELPVEELVFTMSYSSSTNLCIVAATDADFVTITCSCGYLLSRDGKEILKPFYALNQRLMQWNPQHINYVRNKRYRRKNPFRVPLFVFETEYDTRRAAALVAQLRERYRFRARREERGTWS